MLVENKSEMLTMFVEPKAAIKGRGYQILDLRIKLFSLH